MTRTNTRSGRGGAGEAIVEFKNFTPSNVVGIFHPDGKLVRSTPTVLSQTKRYLAGASVDNYALFAGDGVGTSQRNTVDAYTPQVSAARLYVPIGTKYKFGTTEETATSVEITVPTPVTGYIKFKSRVIS